MYVFVCMSITVASTMAPAAARVFKIESAYFKVAATKRPVYMYVYFNECMHACMYVSLYMHLYVDVCVCVCTLV